MNSVKTGAASPAKLSTSQQILICSICATLMVISYLVGASSCMSGSSNINTAATTPSTKVNAQNENDREEPIAKPNGKGTQKNVEQEQQQQQVPPPPPPPSPPQNPASFGSLPAYKPQIRYEPSLFERGTKFEDGATPLTMIKSGQAKAPSLPKDWDGGYGWVFVKYHPSPFELKWREKCPAVEREEGHPLCNLRDREFHKENQIYMNDLPKFPSNNGNNRKCATRGVFPDQPLKLDDDVYSKFEYVFKCTLAPCLAPAPAPSGGPKVGDVKFTYIEPLVGLLRHPMACTNQYDWIINKNYMVVDAWALTNPSRSSISPTPKVLYFDGGASTWSSGSGGASQSWFYSIYEGLCLQFTDWFMFELTPAIPKKVFGEMPGHVKPGYRWFNIGLTTAADHWDNPMNHLLVEAKKEDIVIFKIDFDAPTIELALIQQILDYPQVAELIDELFFEHHVNHEILKNYWGTRKGTEYHSDSLKLFTALRERGVRAHSWV